MAMSRDDKIGEIMDAVKTVKKMIRLYEKRGGGHSQKEALQTLVKYRLSYALYKPSQEKVNDILRTIPGCECWVAMIDDGRIAKAICDSL